MYHITLDDHTQHQLDALPAEGQSAWRELRAVPEVTPWNGEPLYPKTPDGVLTWQFGPYQEGLAYYLVIEHARQVAVLEVHWLANPGGQPASPAADKRVPAGRTPNR